MNFYNKYIKYKYKYLKLKHSFIQKGGQIDINKLKIIKNLGSGNYGNVYLVNDTNKNKYALKIEYIEEDELEKSLKSKVWREIYFCENFSNKYTDFFMKLYSYDVLDDCKEIKTPKQLLYESNDNIKKDKYCSRKLFSLVDTTLNKINLIKFSKNEIYSMIIQLLHIIYLMQNNNYTHNDFNSKNIGIIYTKKKSIKIFDYDIETFGKIYVLIDYGKVLSDKFILTPKEKIKYEEKINKESDEIFLGYILDIFNFKNKKLYKKKYIFEDDYTLFQKSKRYNDLKNIVTDEKLQIYLYDIYYHEEHIKDYYGKNIRVIPNKKIISDEDILFYIKSERNIHDNITYFYKKIIENKN